MNLHEETKKVLAKGVRSVLETGEPWEDEQIHLPAGDAIALVLLILGQSERNHDLWDTNGWQYDWWQKFDHQGKRYVLGGSGYYGGHTFNLDEEESDSDDE